MSENHRTQSIRIADVQIGKRYRQDKGDIAALAESIRTHGLLHPIVVNSRHELIAGERRLLACRRLEWDEIPATVAENLDDALAALQAERDENTCRKDLATSEAVEIGRALEEIEREAAKERQTEGQRAGGRARHGQLGGKLPPSSAGDTRDRVGEAVGLSGKTYEKAKVVVERGAPELVQAMDRGDVSVDAAAKVATLPKDQQRKAVAGGKKAVRAAAAQTSKPPTAPRPGKRLTKAERAPRILQIIDELHGLTKRPPSTVPFTQIRQLIEELRPLVLELLPKEITA